MWLFGQLVFVLGASLPCFLVAVRIPNIDFDQNINKVAFTIYCDKMILI